LILLRLFFGVAGPVGCWVRDLKVRARRISFFEPNNRAYVIRRYNGFQLCLGTTGEGLKNPRTDTLPIVQHLGERGKIHQIHMRNIRGGLHNFEEVYPDEGDLDFLQIMRILRDAQFAGAICPDHMPRHPDDPGGLQAFAFGYGYLKALIQAVNSEVGVGPVTRWD
jgi:D-mannonate dehydratase